MEIPKMDTWRWVPRNGCQGWVPRNGYLGMGFLEMGTQKRVLGMGARDRHQETGFPEMGTQ